uniref:Ubiquitin-like domain-containing protein n=1 Tax=Chromera velia CCMP2878 TaxID=1169474 RepID=A0A0G4G979_9ALVE|eukprot:Cvel_20803.t1-p1 / transcript=Cvel_20803.t1 / gene=Cvel_20803 / organism=Chromera_velia_CCMP2878 / gene_product=hypothetical protein / transcript_product=hypothetical protein / location=Cvel_scaffold1900:24856-25773(+) / protein_length=306 / sequence_SO=supercontig / SO=protein_coding / is_pseudo=false
MRFNVRGITGSLLRTGDGLLRTVEVSLRDTVSVLYDKLQEVGELSGGQTLIYSDPSSRRVFELRDKTKTVESLYMSEAGTLDVALSFQVASGDLGDPLIQYVEDGDLAAIKKTLALYRRSRLGLVLTDLPSPFSSLPQASALHKAIEVFSSSKTTAEKLPNRVACLKELIFSGVCSLLLTQRDVNGPRPLDLAEKVRNHNSEHDYPTFLLVAALDARMTAAFLCRMALLVREQRAALCLLRGTILVQLFLNLDTVTSVSPRTGAPGGSALASAESNGTMHRTVGVLQRTVLSFIWANAELDALVQE